MQIQGLTPLQCELADRIWACESKEEVLSLFDTLPRSLKVEAYVVYQMILWTWLDEEPVTDFTEAQEVIDHVRYLP
jgi:hypothetical protein